MFSFSLVCADAVFAEAVFTEDSSPLRPLIFVTSDWPPYAIVEDNKVVGGYELALITELARRAGIALETRACPWKRCQHMLRAGEADIAASMIYTEKRASYFHFLQPAIKSPITFAFYRLRGSSISVYSHDDLAPLTIGVRAGYIYYTEFDNDTRFRKYVLDSSEQLIKMLLANRVDTFIHRENIADYILNKMSLAEKIDKFPYRHSNVAYDYLVLSRLSPYLNQQKRFELLLNQMQDEGVIEKFRREWLNQQK